jgi:hypothetical protein
MPGTIQVRHDEANDIYVVQPKWLIETEDDCRAWLKQYETYFSKLGKKVDVVLVLDDFHIGAKIGPVWGKYRAEVSTRFMRYSVRVHADARVSTFNATSAALYSASFEEAPNVESAIAFIRRQREAGSA